jgi:hypothetical protein
MVLPHNSSHPFSSRPYCIGPGDHLGIQHRLHLDKPISQINIFAVTSTAEGLSPGAMNRAVFRYVFIKEDSKPLDHSPIDC